jgi:hypothetical protein
VVLEEVVALQPQERVGHLAAAVAGDPGDGDLGVVVADPPGHPAEELEGPDVALEERLGALAGKAQTKKASEYGRVITNSATLVGRLSRAISASPKSTWASPGGWARGTKTSADRVLQAATASFTAVRPPV